MAACKQMVSHTTRMIKHLRHTIIIAERLSTRQLLLHQILPSVCMLVCGVCVCVCVCVWHFRNASYSAMQNNSYTTSRLHCMYMRCTCTYSTYAATTVMIELARKQGETVVIHKTESPQKRYIQHWLQLPPSTFTHLTAFSLSHDIDTACTVQYRLFSVLHNVTIYLYQALLQHVHARGILPIALARGN